MIITEHLHKKHQIFMVPVWRFQYFRHLLQNPNLKLIASFPNNHYWAYTFLNPWAFMKTFCILKKNSTKEVGNIQSAKMNQYIGFL